MGGQRIGADRSGVGNTRAAASCGYSGDSTRYQKRVSGPPLDRIDIHIEVPGVDYDKLTEDRHSETPEAIQPVHGAAGGLFARQSVHVRLKGHG